MRQFEINVPDKEHSLLEHFREAGVFIPAYCGGKGSCGKCRVRFLEKAPPSGEVERKLFSDREIENGWRLACLAHVSGRLFLELADYDEENIAASAEFQIGPEQDEKQNAGAQKNEKDTYAVAVDLGTTTIAAALVNRKKGRVEKVFTCVNHQRAFGADVITRMDASNKGKGQEMQASVRKDLSLLCEKMGLGEDVFQVPVPVILSGNTTMEHLLQGLSCEGLGLFPFTPVDISMHSYKNMLILPGISAYVGADIVSGVVACGIDQREEISILVDLGTNGEMIIGNKHKILAASTAAGPAFEGGNIGCGVAGVPGAIDTVVVEEGKTSITTIGGKPPVGICGTGVVEIVYELVKEGIVDETGLMDEKYFETGYPLAENIFFSPKDVREVQLAKSAIRAGIEVLLACYGVGYSQIDRLYLAGGFGQKMNCRKAVGIGMLPEELEERIIAVGNSSLEGANMLAMDITLKERFVHVAKKAEEVTLSAHERFNDLYMEHMFFE